MLTSLQGDSPARENWIGELAGELSEESMLLFVSARTRLHTLLHK